MTPPNQPPIPPRRPPARPDALPRINREEGPPAPQETAQQPTPRVEDGDAELERRGTPMRSQSPAGGIRLEGPGGWKLSLPHAALLAILACFGGGAVAAKVTAAEGTDRAEVMAELRSIREELKGLRSDVREVRDEQASARRNDKKILTYVDATITPIVASLRKLRVKLEYDGEDRAADVEFHPTPAPGSTAPPIQPRAVLPERPSL